MPSDDHDNTEGCYYTDHTIDWLDHQYFHCHKPISSLKFTDEFCETNKGRWRGTCVDTGKAPELRIKSRDQTAQVAYGKYLEYLEFQHWKCEKDEVMTGFKFVQDENNKLKLTVDCMSGLALSDTEYKGETSCATVKDKQINGLLDFEEVACKKADGATGIKNLVLTEMVLTECSNAGAQFKFTCQQVNSPPADHKPDHKLTQMASQTPFYISRNGDCSDGKCVHAEVCSDSGSGCWNIDEGINVVEGEYKLKQWKDCKAKFVDIPLGTCVKLVTWQYSWPHCNGVQDCPADTDVVKWKDGSADWKCNLGPSDLATRNEAAGVFCGWNFKIADGFSCS
jgi:hypothetical protein